MVQFTVLPIPKNDTRCVLVIRNHGWLAKAYQYKENEYTVHVSSSGMSKTIIAESKVLHCESLRLLPLTIAKYLESKPERGLDKNNMATTQTDNLVFRDERGKYVVSVYKTAYSGASPWGQYKVTVTPIGLAHIVLFATLAEDVSKAKGFASTFIARGKKIT